MYNHKQYDAARDFVSGGDTHVLNHWDKLRIQTYDLYENIYLNSTYQLKIILRGEDQTPILLPTGRKIVETTNRFLGVNVDYLVTGEGDAGAQDAVDTWFKNWFKREAFKTKFESSKRWGLIRGDAVFYIYSDLSKAPGERISLAELDPRQVFEIQDIEGNICGYHVVDVVQDFREPEQPRKKIARRLTFRKALDDEDVVIKDSPVTSELDYFEINAWDDREWDAEVEKVPGGPGAYEAISISPKKTAPITQFPIYKWNNQPMQNTTWGTSQLAGLETLMYAMNQSMTDEDCTIVFQGLGMYVTTASPPIDPNTGAHCDWNIGPMQIIEIGETQKFERVSGITEVSPYQDHMKFIDEKGISESAGIPEVAIGKVDVQSAESGISLKLQFMPLLAQNAEKELTLINLIDQFFHDIVTQWLPAFETEMFGNVAALADIEVVCIFDDPMPVDRESTINEVVLLVENNLILTTMAIKKIRSLGWQYPAVDPDTGAPLSDEDIVQMLLDQAANNMAAAAPPLLDPNVTQQLAAYNTAAGGQSPPGNLQPNTPPGKQTVSLAGG